MGLPTGPELMVLFAIYGALLAFILISFTALAAILLLLRLVLNRRQPKPEIVEDGLAIFDVD